MQRCIHASDKTSQQFKNWESLSLTGCSTPHPVHASSRRFPVLFFSAIDRDGRCAVRVDSTGTEAGRFNASPRNGAQQAIHVGSSRARPRRTSGASPAEVVGGAGAFDDMFDRVVFEETGASG
jgi:hypothetical protein